MSYSNVRTFRAAAATKKPHLLLHLKFIMQFLKKNLK